MASWWFSVISSYNPAWIVTVTFSSCRWAHSVHRFAEKVSLFGKCCSSMQNTDHKILIHINKMLPPHWTVIHLHFLFLFQLECKIPMFADDHPFSLIIISKTCKESNLMLNHWWKSRFSFQSLKCYLSCLYWQSWVNVERHGCSHGFHITFLRDSWLSTGFTDLLCVSTASSITARMEWKPGSVSGVSGVPSDGSLDRSKSSGGSW